MMYGQGMYAAPPLYGVYGYDPRAAADAARGRPTERDPTPVKFTEGKLFIGGVEAQLITKDDLVHYCSKWGEVADAVVMDRKGYGFVTFADPKDAMNFLETRVHELKGRRLDAKAAVPKAHLGTAKLTKKMFVGGTGDLTDDDFREHFSQYGDIEDAAVVRREGMSRGFGFVTFADEISVEKCLLVNHFIKGRKVELKRAVPKEDLGAAAVAASGGLQAVGPAPMATPLAAAYPPQQMYPYPYPPGAYAVRPGAYPPPGAAHMQPVADPYAAWYSMGYMPYYPGMYPSPYGMVPQLGVPYASMPYAAPPGLAAGSAAAAAAHARLPHGVALQEEPPFLQASRTGATAHRGPGRPPAGSPVEQAARSSSSAAAAAQQPPAGSESIGQQQHRSTSGSQQQHYYEVAASPAGAAQTPERVGPSEGHSPRPGSSSSMGQQQQQQVQQTYGSGAALVMPAGSPATAGRRSMVVAYPMVPSVMVRPQPLPMPPRGMMGGPAAAAGQLPGRLQMPGTFTGQQQQRGSGGGNSSSGIQEHG